MSEAEGQHFGEQDKDPELPCSRTCAPLTGGLPSLLPPDCFRGKGPGLWQEGWFGVDSGAQEEFGATCVTLPTLANVLTDALLPGLPTRQARRMDCP